MPVAHTGHLIVDLLYVAPVAVLVISLWVQSAREKRRVRKGEETGVSTPNDRG